MSPAIKFLSQMWEHVRGDSWQRINWAMRDTLCIAIKSGIQFGKDDFLAIQEKFRSSYWIGADAEWVYSLAIESDSPSAYQAWENYVGREPFLAPVSNYDGAGYRHSNSFIVKRGRMAVGFLTEIEGKPWFVSSFDDAGGKVRLVNYGGRERSGKPKARINLSHGECLTKWPAPKKSKAETETVVA